MRQYKKIPAVMKGVKQWVTWGKTGEKPNKNTPLKRPFNPVTGFPADTTKARTWATFEECEKAVEKLKYCGVGFVFNGDYVAIDLDNVIDRKGRILPEAREIIDTLDSYTEYSMSRRGFHIIVSKCGFEANNRSLFSLDPATLERFTNKGKQPGIEIYTKERYFAITGDIFEKRSIIKGNAMALKQIYNEYIAKKTIQATKNIAPVHNSTPAEALTEYEGRVMQRMLKGRNGRKIKALWEGKLCEYPTESEATGALLYYLAFYTNKDPEVMASMFAKSGLHREKWEEKRGAITWGEYEITQVLERYKGRTIGTYEQTTP